MTDVDAMKRYKVVLEDGRHELVVADDYQLIDDEYKFFANGSPISDVFFKESAVAGVTIHTDNYVADATQHLPQEKSAYIDFTNYDK
jgi:hypothetical protein